jgi:hypothetical protein
MPIDLISDKIYQIITFDDGNERCKYVINKWRITKIHEDDSGKVALRNINGKDRVNSISLWKLALIENIQ